MRGIYFYLIGLAFLSCKGQNVSINTSSSTSQYVLDTAWTQTSNNYVVSQPTGIGVDKNNHIFVFQRTGRRWTEPFPDSLISQNTVLELDDETGKKINSWRANYFL